MKRSFRSLTATVAAALLVSACASNRGPGSSTASSDAGDMVTNCAVTAGVVTVIAATLLSYQARKSGGGGKDAILKHRSDIAKAAAAGCVVALAATAVGKLMDAQQQRKHEEAMQAEAQRRALETQAYNAAVQRTQAQPAATPAQRRARDANLERARRDYETSLAKPVTVDLGGGARTTIEVAAPAELGAAPATGAAPGAAAPSTASGCQDFSVLVNTPSGRARQFETWCPNAQGQLVRTEVRPAAAG